LYSSLNKSYYFSFKLWNPHETCDLNSKAEETGSWNCSHFWFSIFLSYKLSK